MSGLLNLDKALQSLLPISTPVHLLGTLVKYGSFLETISNYGSFLETPRCYLIRTTSYDMYFLEGRAWDQWVVVL